ncbi:MAG TPA: zinc-ribbon domain-containing protein, partial [Myxococcota bacterium]
MIIACENCQTRFKVGDDKFAGGPIRVRCSKCNHVFLATPASAVSSSSSPGRPAFAPTSAPPPSGTGTPGPITGIFQAYPGGVPGGVPGGMATTAPPAQPTGLVASGFASPNNRSGIFRPPSVPTSMLPATAVIDTLSRPEPPTPFSSNPLHQPPSEALPATMLTAGPHTSSSLPQFPSAPLGTPPATLDPFRAADPFGARPTPSSSPPDPFAPRATPMPRSPTAPGPFSPTAFPTTPRSPTADPFAGLGAPPAPPPDPFAAFGRPATPSGVPSMPPLGLRPEAVREAPTSTQAYPVSPSRARAAEPFGASSLAPSPAPDPFAAFGAAAAPDPFRGLEAPTAAPDPFASTEAMDVGALFGSANSNVGAVNVKSIDAPPDPFALGAAPAPFDGALGVVDSDAAGASMESDPFGGIDVMADVPPSSVDNPAGARSLGRDDAAALFDAPPRSNP